MSLVSFAFCRRTLLRAATRALIGLAGTALAAPVLAEPDGDGSDDDEIVRKLTGKTAVKSPRVRLELPAVFSNGHGVPMTLAVDSPMTEADYVRQVLVVAPRNPILVVAGFQFTPANGRAAVSTRIRLAESQSVLAVAEMSDGSFLMGSSRVEVTINGCPSN